MLDNTDDSDVVFITRCKPPLSKEEHMDTPIFKEVVDMLGFDQSDKNDPSLDDYYLANQVWAENIAALEKLATVPLHPIN